MNWIFLILGWVILFINLILFEGKTNIQLDHLQPSLFVHLFLLYINCMIRITRIIAKDRIADLLDLNFVSKVELKQGRQGFKNPAICKVNIYLTLPDDISYFHSIMYNIIDKEGSSACVAQTAIKDGFIKESTFRDISSQKRYTDLCNYYSQDFFDLFNRKKL